MRLSRVPWGLGLLGGLILALAGADPAGANCQNGATTQGVTPGLGTHLNQVMESSTPPCTITVGAGTINGASTSGNPFDQIFRIRSGITVRSAGGPGSTILQVPSGSSFGFILQALNGQCPAGATLEGFTIQGGYGGVLVKAIQSSTCSGDRISGVTLRNLVINTDSTNASGTHGVNLSAVDGSVVDSVTVNAARYTGILLDTGSSSNILMNNTVQTTVLAHAIAVQGGNDNVVVGNTINGAGTQCGGGCHGILLNSALGPSLAGSGSSRNRVERNTISGHATDGVTLTDGSRFNYVGLNTAVSSSYHPVSKPAPNPTTGVGIWLNNDSNGNYLFGNDLSGSPENGIDVLTSKSAYLQANRVQGNLQGGIWVANYLLAADTSSPSPQDVTIHHNSVFFNTENAQVHLEGVTSAEVAFNHLSGDNLAGTLAGTNTGGFRFHEGGLSTRGNSVASSGLRVFENTVTDVNNRAIVEGTTQTTRFFRNRFLTGSNNPLAPPGRQGLTYSLSPAGVQWDASRFLGGNHWAEFAASGNPDPFNPYRGFVYDGVHGIDGRGPYTDAFPYQSEHLGATYATYSVAVVEPTAGRVLAAGAKKTIRWQARGCVHVRLSYGSGVLGPTVISSKYPNVGFYFWTVPSVAVRSDYYVQAECLTSTGSPTGQSATGSAFTIAASDLQLMNPGRDFRAVNGGTLRVAWKKSTAVGGVNIFVSLAGGAETQVGNNVTGTFADVTLPGGVASASQVTVRIQDSGSASRQDSVDGTFMTRGGSGAFTTSLSGQSLNIGSIQRLAWVGPSTSYLVDLDLYENGVLAQSIVKNLPDFGNFTWLVPEMWSASSTIRATFKNATGATLTTAQTGSFKVVYQTTPGTAVNRYRLYSPVTLEHLFTTDLNEYTVLGGQAGVWLQEGPASKMHNGPANVGGVEAVPYYRLYDFIVRWHHWTTDRNEYFTLRQNTGRYVAEGVDGYIFPTQVAGTTAWYRLLFPAIAGLHHWTADLNERNTLIGGGSWIEEQKEYVPF